MYIDYFYEIGFEFQEEIAPTARLVHTHALNKTDKLLLNLISFPFLPDRSHVLIIGRFCRKWFIVSVAPRKRKLLCCASTEQSSYAEQVWKMMLYSAKKVIYFTRTRSLYHQQRSPQNWAFRTNFRVNVYICTYICVCENRI